MDLGESKLKVCVVQPECRWTRKTHHEEGRNEAIEQSNFGPGTDLPISREQVAWSFTRAFPRHYVVQLDGFGWGGTLMRVAQHVIRVVPAPPD